MRSSRCSRLAAGVLVAAVVAALVAVPAAAVTTEAQGVPDATEVGTEVEATFTLTDLYEDGVDEWTLRGSTELTGASWTVEKRKLSGDVVSESYAGGSFETTVSAEENVDRVTVTVTGAAPEVESWRYDPPESFAVSQLDRVRGTSEDEIGTWSTHHYTAESRDAREAIDSAREAMGEDPPADAERSLEQAISAYEAGNFENAVSNAEDAERAARDARQSRQRMQLALFGVVGVVALLLAFGGVYYWRSRQETYGQLR